MQDAGRIGRKCGTQESMGRKHGTARKERSKAGTDGSYREVTCAGAFERGTYCFRLRLFLLLQFFCYLLRRPTLSWSHGAEGTQCMCGRAKIQNFEFIMLPDRPNKAGFFIPKAVWRYNPKRDSQTKWNILKPSGRCNDKRFITTPDHNVPFPNAKPTKPAFFVLKPPGRYNEKRSIKPDRNELIWTNCLQAISGASN